MTGSPCKGCQERVLGCHGRCESYKNFRQRLETAHMAEREAKMTSDYWWDFGTKLERLDKKKYRQNRR